MPGSARPRPTTDGNSANRPATSPAVEARTPPIDRSDEHACHVAWRAGDRGAAASLLAPHVSLLRSFFDARCRDASDDLVQQTLLSVLRTAPPALPSSGLRAYLLGVARNRLFDHLRAARRRRFELDDVRVSAGESAWPSPLELLRNAELRGVVLDCMRSLPKEFGTALELHYWQGLRTEKMAETLGVPVGTAKSRLRLARSRFARMFRARYARLAGRVEDILP